MRDEKGRFIKGYSFGPKSKETKAKISKANSGKNNGMWNGGKSESTCKKCGKKFVYWPRQQKGIFCSIKCSTADINPTWLWSKSSIKKSTLAKVERYKDETKHPRWKGDKVGYVPLHAWVYKHNGKASKCEFCLGRLHAKRFEWANISGEYKRDLSDWMSLCSICHKLYDRERKK